MFRNFLILAIRNLLKNKVQSIISIAGLAAGFSVFIMIGLYLKYEYSYDKHNALYDRIYRVQQKVHLTTGTEYWTQSQAALAKYLRENYPEVENSVLLREAWGEFRHHQRCKHFMTGTDIMPSNPFLMFSPMNLLKATKPLRSLTRIQLFCPKNLQVNYFPGKMHWAKTSCSKKGTT